MSKIPTAKLILTGKETYDLEYPTVSKHDALEAMIEFAKLHVEAALKEAKNLLKDGYVTPQDEQDILNAYPLTNIK